jgi:hypothetical protein
MQFNQDTFYTISSILYTKEAISVSIFAPCICIKYIELITLLNAYLLRTPFLEFLESMLQRVLTMNPFE